MTKTELNLGERGLFKGLNNVDPKKIHHRWIKHIMGIFNQFEATYKFHWQYDLGGMELDLFFFLTRIVMKLVNDTSDNSSQDSIFSYSMDSMTLHRRNVPMEIFRMFLLTTKKGT